MRIDLAMASIRHMINAHLERGFPPHPPRPPAARHLPLTLDEALGVTPVKVRDTTTEETALRWWV